MPDHVKDIYLAIIPMLYRDRYIFIDMVQIMQSMVDDAHDDQKFGLYQNNGR